MEEVVWPRRPPRPRRAAATPRTPEAGRGERRAGERRAPVSRHGQIVAYEVEPSPGDQDPTGGEAETDRAL